MMNSNEKRVFRIGLVLCALAACAAGPLAFAALRPVEPVPAPAPVAHAAPVPVDVAPPAVEIPSVELKAAPKPAARRPAPPAKVASRAPVDCTNARYRELERSNLGTNVLYCHN